MFTAPLSGDEHNTEIIDQENGGADQNEMGPDSFDDIMDGEFNMINADDSESNVETTANDDDELDLIPTVVFDKEVSSKGTPGKKVKHTPITPRGTLFKWADNMKYRSMPKYPFKLGVKDESLLIVTLQATDGKLYQWRYKKDEILPPSPQWNNPAWIKAANSWYIQVINRGLNNKKPADNNLRATRAAWSVSEFDNAVRICQRYSQRLNRKLRTADFKQITESYNKHIKGTTVRIGERLMTDETVQKKRASKKAVTADSPTTRRELGGLIGLINKWQPELLAKTYRKANSKTKRNAESSLKGKANSSLPTTKGTKALKLTLNAGNIKSGTMGNPKKGEDKDEDEEMGGMGGANMNTATASSRIV